MTFPSAGCQTCKTRRIKCDETQPVCQRCVKAQRACHGMRTSDSCPVVHNENSYASGHKKRPRGPRSVAQITSNLDRGLHRLPLVDLKTQAVTYYSHYHLRTVEDALNISKGMVDDCLPIWMARADCPMLDLAVSTMALAVFARTQQHPQAALEASLKYHRLLRIAQMAILTLDEGNIDACLLAVFFMSRYEDAVHRPSHFASKHPRLAALPSFSHHDGASAILKIWKDQLSHSLSATNVIKHTRRGLIRSALLRNLALPDWMVEGAFFGEYGLELEYDCIVVRIARARQRLSALLKGKEEADLWCTPNELSYIAEELNLETQDIDRALQDWRNHFPGTWYHQSHILSNSNVWPSNDFFSPVIYSYPSPAYAAVWNQYYATRLLVNHTRLRALELARLNSDEFAEEQRSECVSHMTNMANDLASSVPYCLEKFTISESSNASSDQSPITLHTKREMKPSMASLVVWPLTIASSVADVDFMQNLWFRSVLAHIGRMIGMGVIECAETYRWLEL